MIIETRPTHRPPSLILLPTPDEARIVESILGSKALDNDGLITWIHGRYLMADGYGPAYLSLWVNPMPPAKKESR